MVDQASSLMMPQNRSALELLNHSMSRAVRLCTRRWIWYQEAMFVCPDDLVFVGMQPKCAIVQLGVEYGDDDWEWTCTQCFD